MTNKTFCTLLLLIYANFAVALEPNQILIIANSQIPDSMDIAEYYCAKRNVPTANILQLPLGTELREKVSRGYYNKKIATPVLAELANNRTPGQIKCILTTYGVPIKIANSARPKDSQQQLQKLQPLFNEKLAELRDKMRTINSLVTSQQTAFDPNETFQDILTHLHSDITLAKKRIELLTNKQEKAKLHDQWIALIAEIFGRISAIRTAAQDPNINYSINVIQEAMLKGHLVLIDRANKQNWTVAQKSENNFYTAIQSTSGLVGLLNLLNAEINKAKAKDTYAAVDSELACIQLGQYDIYRWQKNELQYAEPNDNHKTLMTCRLDGPSPEIVKSLIYKSVKAQTLGLKGKAYIDTRDAARTGTPAFIHYDNSLKQLSQLLKQQPNLTVVEEKSPQLFKPGQCPETIIYCGWYSVGNYVDAFNFVDGAIGFHIASFEAMDLRNEKSRKWCPAMLADGITATLGPVNEPYLQSFPEPDRFFAELLNGKTLVEAFFATNPYNSWQMILIGDPLYKLNLK